MVGIGQQFDQGIWMDAEEKEGKTHEFALRL